MSAADELRRALADVGRADLTVFEVLSTMLSVRTPGSKPANVAFVQFHDQESEWAIHARANAKGGWGVHARGATIDEAVRSIVAIGPDVFDPARDPILDLPGTVLRAMANLATDGKLETLGEQAVRWVTIFAGDDWKTTHRAFRRALDAMKKELGPPDRETTTRRLRGAIWGKTALYESDHDPGAGALVQLARWERGEPTSLPPWG